MKKIMLPLILLIGLSACSAPQSETIIVRTPNQEINIIPPQKPRPMKIEQIEVIVYDKERMFVEISNDTFKPFIAMSQEDFEDMLNNLSEANRYIQSQNAIITYYENTINDLKK